MKKFIVIMLMFVGLVSFTKMEDVENLFREVTNTVEQDPSGTVYGIIENNQDNILVNTPVGEYTVNKNGEEYSFMGVSAKLKSKKGNIYTIETSLGEFEINVNKCIITKK